MCGAEQKEPTANLERPRNHCRPPAPPVGAFYWLLEPVRCGAATRLEITPTGTRNVFVCGAQDTRHIMSSPLSARNLLTNFPAPALRPSGAVDYPWIVSTDSTGTACVSGCRSPFAVRRPALRRFSSVCSYAISLHISGIRSFLELQNPKSNCPRTRRRPQSEPSTGCSNPFGVEQRPKKPTANLT